MIDWLALAFNTLWIVGLSVMLSALGWAYSTAQTQRRLLLKILGGPGYGYALTLGMVLFTLGLAGAADSTLERILWLLLTLLWLVNAIFSFIKEINADPDVEPPA